MPSATAKPFPPGDYPVVVVGSGPGGLQISYTLGRLGVEHAFITEDEQPAGMFQEFPFFQRLISWTKPWSPVEIHSTAYQRFDWNSLIGDDPEHNGLVRQFMDRTSYFPSRAEMEQGMRAFVEKTGLQIRYGCRWESTAKAGEGFVLTTSDGEYRCRIAVFAVGMTRPWKPDIPGVEDVPHYVDVKSAEDYDNKRVFIIGKRNSGYEVADGLLPWAKQIILGSPRPSRLSILVHSTAAARARYLQPYEDHVLSGGNIVIDAAIERVERFSGGWRIHATGTTIPGDYLLEVDEVIAATGFTTPLNDLPDLGCETFYQNRLPRQTNYWEAPTVPGIYFAGSVTQGSIGLKKYGIPSTSAAVHGFRYNARVLAQHLAEQYFDKPRPTRALERDELVDFLLQQLNTSPELWNQQSYLAQVVRLDRSEGIYDDGIEPLAHFVDTAGPDAVAAAVETDAEGDIHPAIYVRRAGRVDEFLLESDTLQDFNKPNNQSKLEEIIKNFD